MEARDAATCPTVPAMGCTAGHNPPWVLLCPGEEPWAGLSTSVSLGGVSSEADGEARLRESTSTLMEMRVLEREGSEMVSSSSFSTRRGFQS